ncbi:MAG: hypothetical protein AAFQ90_01935 [Pseudomonadota bacterium]
MSPIAIMMFFILASAATLAFWQYTKAKKKLPEDTSHITPGQTLQQMDRASQDPYKTTRGTKKDPLKS